MFSGIRKALDARLESLPSSPQVVWQNAGSIKSPPSGIHLTQVLMPAEPEYIGKSGSKVNRGIYQITVCTRAGEGVLGIDSLLDRIISHFSRGTELQSPESGIKVTVEKVWISQGFVSDSWYKVPVSIRYISFT